MARSQMREAVRALLNAMDDIADEWAEVTDTVVRGCMREAITDGFVDPKPDFVLAAEFGMGTAEGDAAVRKALGHFLPEAGRIAAREGLDTPSQRLRAFQCGVTSDDGAEYDEYFNHVE